MNRLWPRMRSGAFHGLEVFVWYAVAEYVFLAVTLVIRPHRVMLLPQWRGTGVLFLCYAAIGILAGMVAALLIRRPDPHGYRVRKSLILTVLAAFALNGATTAMLAVPNKIALVGSTVLIAIAVLLNLGSTRGDPGLGKEPVLAFSLLVITGWAISNTQIANMSPALRIFVVPGAVVVLLAAAVAAKRVFAWWGDQTTWAGMFEHGVKIVALAVLALAPGILSSQAEGKPPVWPTPPAGSQPNVVLVTLDTVTAGHMGLYGYFRHNTPRLEEFARHSTLFTNFVAAAPLTLTSHASIFTGLYPQSHGAYKGFSRFLSGRPLAQNIPTLAQVLTNHGYRTMAVVANRYFLGAEFGTLRGFQFVDWIAPTMLVSPDRDYLLRSRLRELLRIGWAVRDLDDATISGADINQRGLALLDQAKEENAPFFLFLNYTDAHMPYIPPPPYNSMYPGRDLGYDVKHYALAMNSVNNGNHPLPARAREHLVSQYDGAIAYLDEKMGELIDRLKRNGQYDNTLIILTSDHGESFGDRNILFHDGSVYQEQVHVPLLVKYPDQTQPERVDTVAGHVDIMPTVLDIAGIQAPPGMQGMDLRKVGTDPQRVVTAEMHGSTQYPVPRFQQVEYALYSWPYKMIYSDKGMRELYDLSTDPNERHNLYRLDAPETAILRTKLTEWSRRTPPRFLDPGPANREVEKRLESLGYAHGVD